MSETKRILLKRNKIEVSFPYSQGDVYKIRDIAGRRWDKAARVWKIPATAWHAEKVLGVFWGDGFYIDPKVSELSRGKIIPPKMKFLDGMYKFQEQGVEFALSAGGRCLIADEMGTGKTVEALAFKDGYAGRTLIISPTNVTYKWENECRKWIPHTSAAILKTGKDVITQSEIIILSYGLLFAHFQELNKIPFDLLIVDEAHYCKNYRAQRTKLVRALVKGGIPKVLFLSGTPFMNRPGELFPILNMIDPIGYDNFWVFAQRYCGAQYYMGQWVFPPNIITNTDELAQRLSRVMIRRTKREVLSELPDLTRSTVPVDLTNKAEYRRALRDLQQWLKERDKPEMNLDHVLTRLNVLRQVIGDGKVDAAVELAENVLQDGRQVVLFAHHYNVVLALSRMLLSHGVGIISGNTPASERADKIRRFLSSSSGIRVMIITSAGAEGIDLYTSSDIIFVEREWTPAIEEQAEGRLHRIGQKNAVNAYYLVANGTVDEKLDRTVRDKRGMIGQVISQDEIINEILYEL